MSRTRHRFNAVRGALLRRRADPVGENGLVKYLDGRFFLMDANERF